MADRRTRDCPVASECAVCGRRRGLEVREAQTDFGISCVTVCVACGERGELPPINPLVAAVCVNAHLAHLGEGR